MKDHFVPSGLPGDGFSRYIPRSPIRPSFEAGLWSGAVDYLTQAKIHRTIVETLAELGIPNAKFSITDTTIQVQDGCYLGRSFVCGHVRVVIRPGGQRIEFYGSNGEPLRRVQVDSPFAGQREAA